MNDLTFPRDLQLRGRELHRNIAMFRVQQKLVGDHRFDRVDLICARQHQGSKIQHIDTNVFQPTLPDLGFIAFFFFDGGGSRLLVLVDGIPIFTQKTHPDIAVFVRVFGIFQRNTDWSLQRVTERLRLVHQIFDRDLQLQLISFQQGFSQRILLEFIERELLDLEVLGQFPLPIG